MGAIRAVDLGRYRTAQDDVQAIGRGRYDAERCDPMRLRAENHGGQPSGDHCPGSIGFGYGLADREQPICECVGVGDIHNDVAEARDQAIASRNAHCVRFQVH